jgi:hypothetical protein
VFVCVWEGCEGVVLARNPSPACCSSTAAPPAGESVAPQHATKALYWHGKRVYIAKASEINKSEKKQNNINKKTFEFNSRYCTQKYRHFKCYIISYVHVQIVVVGIEGDVGEDK